MSGPRVGTFVAVVGPSGAGKDSIMRFAQRALAADTQYVFVKRTITRPPDAAEDHLSVSPLEFQRLAAAGGFALQWEAHGLSYGIPATIFSELSKGNCVVANVSRGILATARNRFSRLIVVQVTAPPEVLAARLANRDREAAAGQQARLDRSRSIPQDIGADVTIVNDGALEEAGQRFESVLRQATSAELMPGQ